jgi:Ca2+-transporting ATPase
MSRSEAVQVDPAALAGLSGTEARARFERHGANELRRQQRRSAMRIAIEVMREPMLLMLVAAGAIYLALGDLTEALVLLAFACVSILLTIVQETRTERALEALQDLAAPRALVLRDGEPVRIPGREVVPGDVLIIDQGDRIAADAGLLEAQVLEVDESLLTGESVAASKVHAGTDATPADKNMVFAGTIVTRGSGLARVVATGAGSRIGQIGLSLATLDAEPPRLQKEMAGIVRWSAVAAIMVALLVVLLYGITRGAWLEATLAGISSAMSLLPEEIPVVLTVFLAMGAWRIAKVGVLTRRTSAVETLGAATVLCTDKTGTLTLNKMRLCELWLPSGQTFVLGKGSLAKPARELLTTAALASAPLPADPMEIALHEAVTEAEAPHPGLNLLHANALRPELLAMSNVWRSDDPAHPVHVAAKGAPEAIAELCRLSAEERSALEQGAQAMAQRGIRVLGVAAADIALDDFAADHRTHEFRLLGLAGLADPLRPGVAEGVAQCREAGIKVVMITGDHPATARAIAAQAGIADAECLTGRDMAELSDDDLARCIRRVTVFARIAPEQKLRIVEAFKRAGEIVAMTGDGVNDAAALKAAHIGVAMGKRGTDVAREAAAIVLVNDEFGAIVQAIRTGRRIYDNLRKALGFIVCVHVPIAGIAILPLLLGEPVILGPIQIALIEMIIDPVCALAFEAEAEERDLMQRPPRPAAQRLLTNRLAIRALGRGGLAFGLLAILMILHERFGISQFQLRTFLFLALVACVVALIAANRTFTKPLGTAAFHHNKALAYILVFVFALVLAIHASGAVRLALGFAALDLVAVGAALAAGALLSVMLELAKKLPAIAWRVGRTRSALG